ncbi:CatB-related O-acetyltransferase [Photobacterium damselae]|uniref:CatB-related O-acetyltransferase n=1 Tax=Photobacterium damselae TaxID=38293 RepID=UPI0023DED43F|nr:CatB-related O-acetyltransferase [Photobacterium damselae]MCG3811772.1 CatB-related O-acetyltransferase [Photobacterium damselae]
MKKRKVLLSLKSRKKLKENGISLPKRSLFTRFKLPTEKIVIEQNCRVFKGHNLWSMGAFSYSHSQLPINISVGRYCSIANNVKTMGVNHPLQRFTTSSITYDKGIFPNISETLKIKEILPPPKTTIKNDVWIAENVLIKNGIVINDGAVIAANSVVTKDVPPYAVVGGSPAKIIKYRFPKEVVQELIQIEWWNYRWFDHKDLDLDLDIQAFISVFKELKNKEAIKYFYPQKITL